jgi:8-oxo-dGTP diphosphatase
MSGYPRVGVGVWVRKNGKVLLGRRAKQGFGFNTWCAPGGAVETNETLADAAIREVREETSLVLTNVKFMTVVDDIFEQHWITPYFVADWELGEPRNEDGVIGEWQWFEWEKLPESLYGPTRNFVNLGYNPLNF